MGGMEQEAVTMRVVLLIPTVALNLVTVRSVRVVVTVTRLGVMVVVRLIVVEGSVIVTVGPVEVEVSVTTTVELTIGV